MDLDTFISSAGQATSAVILAPISKLKNSVASAIPTVQPGNISTTATVGANPIMQVFGQGKSQTGLVAVTFAIIAAWLLISLL